VSLFFSRTCRVNEFKHVRNLARKESRKIAQKVQSDIAQCCRHNPKKFWQYINSKTSSKSGIGDIVAQVGNSRMTLTTDLEKAEHFSKFFASVYSIEMNDHFNRLQ